MRMMTITIRNECEPKTANEKKEKEKKKYECIERMPICIRMAFHAHDWF